MPPMNNPKHEVFAQERVRGATQGAAAVAAGYSERTARTAGSKIEKSQTVRVRIEELRALADRRRAVQAKRQSEDITDVLAMDQTWVLGRLRQVFQVAMDNGQLAAANRALELIGKELRMFVDRKSVTIDRIERLDVKQLQAAITEIDEKLAELKALPAPMIDVTPAPTEVA